MFGSKSDYLENKLLDHVFGNTAYSAPTTVYIGLFTASPSDSGGGTEVSGGSYARVAVTNSTTNWPAASSGSKSNGTSFSYPAATASWGTIEAMGVFDAATGGNLLAWAQLMTGSIYVATAKASTDTFTSVGHSLVNTNTVRAAAINGATATLPTGVAAATTYYVVGVSGDTFQLSLTSGGAAINLTADGAALIQQTNFKTVSSGETPSFAGSSITIGED